MKPLEPSDKAVQKSTDQLFMHQGYEKPVPAQHTPGPWRLGNSGTVIWATDGAPVADTAECCDRPLDECLANARLIIVGSELLAVLKELLPVAENWACNCEINGEGKYNPAASIVNRAKSLVAKAEGRGL